MTSLPTLTLIATLAAASPLLAGEHRHTGHRHGVARLTVAVDGPTLAIRLESPLGNLLGFEHAPRTEGQKRAAQALLATLRRGEGLFVPTLAAGCKLVEARVEAPVLEGRGGTETHADLEAEWRYTCARPARLTGLKAGLLDRYRGLRRLDAAAVTAKGQRAARLAAGMPYLSW